MTKIKKYFTNQHQILWVVLSIVGLIIIIGSTIAVAQTGISLQSVRDYVSQFAAHLGGSNLYVQLERTQLPADGESQGKIWVTPINTNSPLTANIIRGEGVIKLSESEDDDIIFIYTAGSNPDEVKIMFVAGVLKETVSITLIHSETPSTPIITNPPDNTQINNSRPEVIGTGAKNTKIIITDNGETNTITRTDKHGRFQTHLDNPLYNGQHTLSAIAVNELGVRSPASALITITIKTNPARIDRKNIRTAPTNIIAGGSYGVFVPTSLNAKKVKVEIHGEIYELFDFNETSIFTGTLPAPLEPGVYVGNIIVTDVSGNINRFDSSISVSIISG